MIDLYHRNFDVDFESVTRPKSTEAAAPPPPPAPVFTQDEVQQILAEATAKAFDEGKAVGMTEAAEATARSDAARNAEITASILTQLEDLTQQDALRRKEMERDIVELLLGVTERLVPEMLDGHASDLISARIRTGLRLTGDGPTVIISVAPQNEARIRAEALTWVHSGFTPPRIEIASDSSISDAAVRISWQNGYLDYDLDRVCKNMLEILRRTARKMNEQLKKAQ